MKNIFQNKKIIGYLAPKNYELNLQKEFDFHNLRILEKFGQLYILEKHSEKIKINWVQNIWFSPEICEIQSINDASKILRSNRSQWKHYPYNFMGRCKLIESNLPKLKIPSKISFPFYFPASYSLGIVNHFNFNKFFINFSNRIILPS